MVMVLLKLATGSTSLLLALAINVLFGDMPDRRRVMPVNVVNWSPSSVAATSF